MPKTDMPELSHVFLQRTMCDVLEEMRVCVKTLNFGGLLGMVEEAQTMGNRMEAGLGMNRDVKSLTKDIHNLKEAREKLKEEVQALIDQRGLLEKKDETEKEES